MPVVVILIILALIFGVGSVLKGILWLGLIAIALIVVAGAVARALFSDR